MRPPYLSVQMPSGTRINEPVSTGTAVNRPNPVALRLSAFDQDADDAEHHPDHEADGERSVLTIRTDQAFFSRFSVR